MPYTSDQQPPTSTAQLSTAQLMERLERWQRCGLITHAEAMAIAEFERLDAGAVEAGLGAVTVRERARGGVATSRRGRVPMVAEALGYLGGALAIAGLILLVSPRWADLSTPMRLALTGVASVVFLMAGVAIREEADPALMRLRWVTWLVSTGLAGGFAGVMAHDVFGFDEGRLIAGVVSAVVAVHAGFTWRWRPRPLQQLVCLGALGVLVGSLGVQWFEAVVGGLAVWVLGIGIGALGLTRRTPLPLLTMVVAAVTVMAGSIIAISDRPAVLPFAAASALGIGAVAVIDRFRLNDTERVVLVVLSGIALLQTAPGAVGYFAEQAGVATGLVTWTVGALLLGAASRPGIRLRPAVVVLGGLVVVGGGALCGAQSPAVATVVGLGTAVTLVALGTRPGWSLLSVFGAVGLLIHVPWSIAHFFPGEGRAPLLIVVSGVLLIGLSVLLARQSGRIRRELGATGPSSPRPR